MNLGRFRDIVEAYGADSELWPESERAAALALSRSSLPAARLLAGARALDGALRGASISVDPGPRELIALKDRIMAAAIAPNQGWLRQWFGVDLSPARLWPSLAGLAFATALGVAVGAAGLLQMDSDREPDDGSGWMVADMADAGVSGE